MASPRAYFDSSVLVKRFVEDEGGSVHARNLMRRYSPVSSVIAPAEITSALSRRRAGGQLSESQLATALVWLRDDRRYWELIEVTPQVIERAEELLLSMRARTLDALHLASAASASSGPGVVLPFITADVRQRDAARLLPLEVVWVES